MTTLTFDEQLQQVLDTFTARLHDEVAEVGRQIRNAGDELAASARPDPAPAPLEATPPPSLEKAGHLVEGLRALGAAGSLSEVLDTLVGCAGHEASRVGILLARGDRFHGWRFVGFDSAVSTGNSLDIAQADSGIVAHALQSAAPVSIESSASGDAPPFAALTAGEPCLAVPLVIGGQVVAVVYADGGTVNREPVEILTLFAAQRLEALTAIKAARSLMTGADSTAR